MDADVIAAINTAMSMTHEDLEAYFAASGYGCRACPKRTAAIWWKCSGDTYCDGCKKRMTKTMRGLTWIQVAHRAA